MGQHRDLKINYDNLGVIYDTIKKYIDALKDLQTSTNTFVNVINEQKGDTFVELNKEFEDSITVDYDDLISVLTEVYNNFGSYMKDMTALISPEDSSAICRVDRNDIAWNLQQIRCIPYAYVGDHPTVPSHIYFDEFVNPFADDADEVRARNEENRRKRERNYDKLVNFYNTNILQTASALSNEVDGLNKIHNDYVIEYENTDDIYASRLDDIYDSIKDWKDILEDIWNVVKDIFRGFGRGIVDLIKGLKAPLEIASALNPNIYLPLGVRAAFLSDGVNELYQFGKAFVDDPENAIGAIFQGIADTSDEEGFAFSAGYVGEKIVEVVLAKKLAEKISGPKVEGAGEAAGEATDAVTYRRVQGGVGNNASQVRIEVNPDGTINIPNKDANLCISIDGGEHSEYFLSKRGGNATVVEVDVPKWFDDFLQENAIPQVNYKSNPLNQGGTAPKITDITTPGNCFEIPAPWIEWLEEYGTNARIIVK